MATWLLLFKGLIRLTTKTQAKPCSADPTPPPPPPLMTSWCDAGDPPVFVPDHQGRIFKERHLPLAGCKHRMIPDLDSVFVVNLIKSMNKQSVGQKYETP